MRLQRCVRCALIGHVRRQIVHYNDTHLIRVVPARYSTSAALGDVNGSPRALKYRPKELLAVLRQSRWSEDVPSTLIESFLAHADVLDQTSRHHAVKSLISTTLRRGTRHDLQKVLAIVVEDLGSARDLNSYIEASALARGGDAATIELQDAILSSMRDRRLPLSDAGASALQASAKTPERQAFIRSLLGQHGYSTDEETTDVAVATAVQAAIERVLAQQHSADPGDLGLVLDHVIHHSQALSSDLTDILVKHLSLSQAHDRLDDLLQLASSQKVKLGPSAWSHYLRHLARTRREDEACHALVSGIGTRLFALDPTTQGLPRLWTALIDGLNHARVTDHLTATAHAHCLSSLASSITQAVCPVDNGLLHAMSRAVIASGENARWSKSQPGDVLTRLFSGMDNCTLHEKTWRAYLISLVAEEREDDLCLAMSRMLDSGVTPSPSLVQIFAVGVWEAGSVDLIYDWQRYLESIEIAWPDSNAVFATKRHLERRDLLLYRS